MDYSEITFREAHALEKLLAQTKTCCHGHRLDLCPSSMCYIHGPEDSSVDPDSKLGDGEATAFLTHLALKHLR